MNYELEKQLADDFPHFFAALKRRTLHDLPDILTADLRMLEPIEAFGIECGDGWYGLIRRLAESSDASCAESGSYCVQLKEKFGTMRCYMSQTLRVVPRDSSAGDDKSERDTFGEIESESERTCEKCGAEGKLRNHNGWYTTRCDECDSPAKRFIERSENVERFLRYVVKPKSEEETRMWRRRLRG